MIKSMTGFGMGDRETDDYKIHVEIKAVNSRYLELDFRMARALGQFEDDMRRAIKAAVNRGKLDISIMLTDKRLAGASVRLDRALALAYQKAINEMSDLLRLSRLDDIGVMASLPDVLQIERQHDLPGCRAVLLEAVEQAVSSLDDMRGREGKTIAADFRQRLETLHGQVSELEELGPTIVSHYRERLQNMLSELLSAQDIDETRLIQETAIYADKINYTEEIVRLKSHFEQFGAIVGEATGPVGRKLDFLMQEMNREANTIGSKAGSETATKLVVEIKSEIEKLREQVQNIE